MNIFRKLAAAVIAGAASLMLAACATGLPTKVTRYSAMPVPAGQTFAVVPADGQLAGLQFNTYAAMIAQQLQARGYAPAANAQAADMLVSVDYGVDEGRTEYVAERPFGPSRYRWGAYGWSYRDPFYDPFWGIHYGRPYWSPWARDPFYYGWDDPFWYASPYAGYGRGYGGFGPRVREYTRYESHLDMKIVRRADNAPLFEGRVQARSQTDELGRLVPNLIQAMFTGFPGRSGETVKITVPARRA